MYTSVYFELLITRIKYLVPNTSNLRDSTVNAFYRYVCIVISFSGIKADEGGKKDEKQVEEQTTDLDKHNC